MLKKIAAVLADNGAIYWGEPVTGFENCITLQNVKIKAKESFPTKNGRLSIPIYRILEIIEVDDTFQSAEQILNSFLERFGKNRANDIDDPSIAQSWLIEAAETVTK